ncbi:neurocan core protein [Lingula anatina]|uniref:Neurocan core protein n=1 Tax=Lingula anatina TaxID=7574 RepID=A0A1S3JFE9_LINAN|nr:neurocan core protein [Lingula anatina]|eukprot:XP_013409140.1 neurocan core protein [Lingula anatina]
MNNTSSTLTAKSFCFLVWLLGLFCQEVGTCDVPWERYGRNCYRYYASVANYDDANANCAAEGGHLVTTKTGDVHNFVMALRPSGGDMWIGLKDLTGNAMTMGPAGDWQWADGSRGPLNWQTWAASQLGGSCISQDGTQGNDWLRNSCTSQFAYMCQKPLGNNDGLWRKTRTSKQADSNLSTKTEYASTLTECAIKCLGEPSCIAFNIGPSVLGRHECVMFDNYGKDDNLYTDNDDWNFYEFVQ